jgi:hypothetical protein
MDSEKDTRIVSFLEDFLSSSRKKIGSWNHHVVSMPLYKFWSSWLMLGMHVVPLKSIPTSYVDFLFSCYKYQWNGVAEILLAKQH